MGDPKKQRKKFETPGHRWIEDVLSEELQLIGSYGLRNKRELWRHRTALSNHRKSARSLLAMPAEKRSKLEAELLAKLHKLGLIDKEASIERVLDLVVQSILDRRLQTQVARMGLARSLYQARQLITHGHIFVGDRKITSPSYIVRREEEPKIRYSSDSPLDNEDHPLKKGLTQQS